MDEEKASPMRVLADRARIFSEWLQPPAGMREMTHNLPTHDFLNHPSGAQPFLYLSRYVAVQTRLWFGLPPAELKILDWGCGKGHASYLLQKHGLTTVPADLPGSEPAHPLLDATGLPFVPLLHDVELPFDDESFHCVLSFGVLEHVPDDRASLHEIFRVLKPGGLLFVFNLPQHWSWITRLAHLRGNYYHDRLYDPRGTRALLAEAGLHTLDMWRRQLLPKNSVRYPSPPLFERLDQLLCKTPLAVFATSLEVLASRPE